jgi:glutaminyl-tRNA synthetase
MKEYRGSLSEPGKNSPNRNRTVEENISLFEKMRKGEFEEGSMVLRAKIDMSSPNINMRDPVMYRILKKSHHRTGNKWVIYPSYDFTHGQSDSIEGITHSLCDISFENHRPLYEWFIQNLGIYPSRQIEFARLNLTYTITSKRFLKKLVDEKIVSGWDDPRMPTLIGMRRKGIPPEAIIEFMKSVGVSKKDSLIDVANFEFYVRENLKKTSPHVSAILDPVKLTIVNYPDELSEEMEMDSLAGGYEVKRTVPLSKDLLIERTDYREENDPDFFRLSPGKYVKLRKSYMVKCISAVKDGSGKVTEVLCEYVPDSLKKMDIDGKKIKGIIHWLSEKNSVKCSVRLYGRLFTVESPLDAKDKDFSELVDPGSVTVLENCVVEKFAASASPEMRFQFIRNGYFCADIKDHSPDSPVFNRTLGLK